MDEQEAREIAGRIVAELFQNGAREQANRLVLMQDNPQRNLGGWGRLAVEDRIVSYLVGRT